jgi:exodeoxyribonuclease V alpha subunit
LVIDAEQRVYLARYFDYEQRLARAVARLARRPVAVANPDVAAVSLVRSFAGNETILDPGEADWQKLAAALALQGSLTVISGGPGTGKTTTVAAALACLLEQDATLRVALAAPTGKAAGRMLLAVRRASEALPESVRARLPDTSHTVHRLLGARPGSVRFRHDARNPLPVDVLVVDEASMLDVALAARLCEALPPCARLILVGDKDQLAAVEAGSVFSALAANPYLSPDRISALSAATGITAAPIRPRAGCASAPMADTTIWLSRSYRFGAASAIAKLAGSIRDGSIDAEAIFDRPADAGRELNAKRLAVGPPTVEQLDDMLSNHAGFLARLRAREPDPRELLDEFERHRVLCALRHGPRGVKELGDALAGRLLALLGRTVPRGETWFAGRPVLVTRNDYNLGLSNGDVGICLPARGGGFEVWISDAAQTVRSLPASHLPPHETALAMTVHKAQGSEFETVSLVLPEGDNPVMSRELLYTAVTRARRQLVVWGDPDVMSKAVNRPAPRHSGLAARLAAAWASADQP